MKKVTSETYQGVVPPPYLVLAVELRSLKSSVILEGCNSSLTRKLLMQQILLRY